MQHEDDDDKSGENTLEAQDTSIVVLPPRNVAQHQVRPLLASRAMGKKPQGPTKEELAIAQAERESFIENDRVVTTSRGLDSLATLRAIKASIARETAELAYQRQQYAAAGRDIGQVASRRIDALKKIADIELEMRKIGVDQVDVYSDKMQRIFKFWTELLLEAMEATLQDQEKDLLINKLTTVMEGWEDRASDLVK